MKSVTPMLFILITLLVGNVPIYAEDMDMSSMDMASSVHATGIEAVGIVNEVDAVNGVVTISHEAVKSLDWPAMIMNFSTKDKKLLGKLGKGKKVHFAFIQRRGKYEIIDVK